MQQAFIKGVEPMGDYFTPFSLRISEELLEKIKELAKKNKRSANKEIEFILESYVEKLESPTK